ncbi:hypothetical protein SAMN06309944_0250 [Micrococcales bacterium KH10]|nr:hypothetical protein SAMN06309944_0250 [Micrococcales bacterium KH10]
MSTAAEFDEFWVHTVTVRTLIGTGAYGDVHAEPVEVTCFAEDKRRLVRNSDGKEVISETTLSGPVERSLIWTPGSLVTLPSGREATVITTSTFTSGDLDLPDHSEAVLT